VREISQNRSWSMPRTKLLNRFVVQVRSGVVLFFNRAAAVDDGWWWGTDADPLQHGPFASSQAALADARRDDDRFKVVRSDDASIKRDEPELRPTGHIVIIDTAGRLLVKTGEDPPPGWWPRN
jgi:hypothetical protein